MSKADAERALDEHPEVDPERRKLAVAALMHTAKRQRETRYWERIERAAVELWSRRAEDVAPHAASYLRAIVDRAREMIDAIDAARAEEET